MSRKPFLPNKTKVVAHVQLANAHITTVVAEKEFDRFANEVKEAFANDCPMFVELKHLDKREKPIILLSSKIEGMWTEFVNE